MAAARRTRLCWLAMLIGAVLCGAIMWLLAPGVTALTDGSASRRPRETIQVPTVPTLPISEHTVTATVKPTGPPTSAPSPTLSATATPTEKVVHLPVALKRAQGLIPTLTPTVTPTWTFTPTPTITPTSTPAITQPYGTLSVNGDVTDRPAHLHPDLNLAIRGYVPVNAALNLIDLGGATDFGAPNLRGLCASASSPRVATVYQVYDWDWGGDARGEPITNPEVTLLGLEVRPGELVYLPPAGYDLGEGYNALVLYATTHELTLKYTREDNVVYGYTIHLQGIAVDPTLLALYTSLDLVGRNSLPALYGGQAFGWANGRELRVAIRDTGSFMETRSRKDWWR